MKESKRSDKGSRNSRSLLVIPSQINQSDNVEKINMLHNKVNPFKVNFADTYNYQKTKSIKYQLAQSIFTNGKEIELDLKNPQSQKRKKKKQKRKRYKSLIFDQNLSKNHPLFKNLINQTNTVPEYNKINHDLLNQKQQLTKHIDHLKKKITQEQKIKSKMQINSLKCMNSTQLTTYSANKNSIERERINLQIDILLSDIEQINSELQLFEKHNKRVSTSINNQKEQIKYLEQFINTVKKAIITRGRQLNDLKAKLTGRLKSLNHSGAIMKELEDERSQVLLFINKSFEQNKLK